MIAAYSGHRPSKATPVTNGPAVAAGRQKPSPVPKPKTPALDVRKQDGKGKTDPAGPGEDGKAVARPGRQAASARKS